MDAFAFACAFSLVLAVPAVAAASEPSAPVAADPVQHQVTHERDKTHAVTARADAGKLGYGIGAGYMHLWEQADDYDGRGGIGWFAGGGDVRVLGAAPSGKIAGAGVFGDARVSFVGDAMGAGFEVSAGVADVEGRPRVMGSAGMFFGLLYGEIGYSYQVPLDGGDRAGIIASHMISLRVTVPVHTYEKIVTHDASHP